MKKDWNIKGGMAVNMSDPSFKIAYRAQAYNAGYSEANGNEPGAYDFHNFSNTINRRFIPNKFSDSAYYMGFDPLAVFVENNKDFREASRFLPRPLPFSQEELAKTEIISFSGFGNLRLFDLNSSLSLSRHNVRPYDPELVSVDYTLSSLFADEVYEEGYDGIMFRTRQGITKAAVVWGRAKAKITCCTIQSRKSALTVINSIPNAQQLLGIEIDEELD